MNVMPINPISLIQALGSGAPVPLGDRMANAMAEAYVKAGADRSSILTRSNDGYTATNPAALHQLHKDLATYTTQMALTAGLLGKATKGLDTILKS